MNEWKTLFLKEVKEQRALFIFLLALTTIASVVAVTSITSSTETSTARATIDGIQHQIEVPDFSFHIFWVLVPYGVVFILPFMFTHSLAQEMKGQTHFLLLSLPVSRAAVFLCKAGALLAVAIAVYVVATAALHVVYLRLAGLVDSYAALGTARIAPRHLWLLIGEVYFSLFFMLLGTACGIAGLRLVVNRFQGVMAAAFFGCVVYCYARALRPALEILGPLGTYRIPLIREAGGWNSVMFKASLAEAATIPAGLDLAVYSILFGLALIGFGVWLFEVRAEA